MMISSVQFRLFWTVSNLNCVVVSNSLWLNGQQHARPPCPSPTPRVYSNSCPSSRWCHPTISTSVDPFSSHLQSFPASGPFPVSQFFTSGGQSIGASASASVLPMNIQDWSPLGWTGWISYSPRDCQESSPTPQFKSINSLVLSLLHSWTMMIFYFYPFCVTFSISYSGLPFHLVYVLQFLHLFLFFF